MAGNQPASADQHCNLIVTVKKYVENGESHLKFMGKMERHFT